MDIRKIFSIDDLLKYFAEELHWPIDFEYIDEIDDVMYEFDAKDLGLKEEAFAKINSLKQLQSMHEKQPWGIFCVEFESEKFQVTVLRKILSSLVPKKRNSPDHKVWDMQDLMFICFWGHDNNRTIGIAHFDDRDKTLPQIKMISCAPALEGYDQIKRFSDRLSVLSFPKDPENPFAWQADWSSAFTTGYREVINTSRELAVQLAASANEIHNTILEILDVETNMGYVHLLYKRFKETLVDDMTESEFADMYAQTIVYGLFSARCMDDTPESFSAEEAVECMPITNPFLKNLMKECIGAGSSSHHLSFDELGVETLCVILK